ncbi:transcriptional regulator [Pseudomonas sp. LAIL14HWK12:I7]|uniref:transcriptional regulator n=1 Tax=Pseudomonas sp. LAIL14HWK12:I7 TaxID=1259801 RepID=UPI0021098FF1|nr:transcriptional regulator [Pseudomonas sp. LAIL14HWK12:I7]
MVNLIQDNAYQDEHYEFLIKSLSVLWLTLTQLTLTMASLMTTFFPVACADTLSKIGLLVKARRLALGLRQADITAAIGVSAHTLRKIEGGSALVDLRSFMLVLWRLGISETVFASLEGIEQTSQITRFSDDDDAHQSLASRRVRLAKPKPEEF